MFNTDEWDDYEPGIYRLDNPTQAEIAYHNAQAKMIGLRVKIRLARRLLEQADTIEKVLFWTIKIAEWEDELDWQE